VSSDFFYFRFFLVRNMPPYMGGKNPRQCRGLTGDDATRSVAVFGLGSFGLREKKILVIGLKMALFGFRIGFEIGFVPGHEGIKTQRGMDARSWILDTRDRR
jgi:hypothetical protein